MTVKMDVLVEEMLEWWLENEELGEKLENFTGKHCKKFPDPNEKGECPEQTPELMALYNEFKDLLENEIVAYLNKKGVSIEDFYAYCKDSEAGDGFLQWVLAATEYPMFWRTMVDEKNR
eukprot:TRINITY_DN17507_c0_g1_i1.p1 TRINITY_DN17507_c0_g1~~TRINITY_DN17507_c0_g1_i1.p1  ORF type:complete len:119 (+),score=40.03 TRINITY_DN17507_c0_g1_i1:445-801(+)